MYFTIDRRMLAQYFTPEKKRELVYPKNALVLNGCPSLRKNYDATCEYIGVSSKKLVGRNSFRDNKARERTERVAKFSISYRERSKFV